MGLAEGAEIPFVQEVWATGEVVKNAAPDTNLVIELGGEDAKIIFFDGAIDERMNGTCAGGTGAFIDQMATLLDVTPDELDEMASLLQTDAAGLNEYAKNYQMIYPIAARCGVFAKSDVQPLLNQGAAKEDVAASIYQAVVNQTIAGLAQGRKIEGKVMFLGGPLYYNKGLRERFVETLKLTPENAIFPEYARNAVSIGAAIYASTLGKTNTYTIDELISLIKNAKIAATSTRLPPLFKDEADYREFAERHAKADVDVSNLEGYSGRAYLGIDCGSTTTKLALIGEDSQILYTYYDSNRGNPVEIVRAELAEIYKECGDRVHICGSAVTGYGEELIQAAFGVDDGIVETVAHYTAAKFFKPDVDFILDIGGQDIKCFKIKNGAIDKIMLNEACSSGCGSFIETFARGMHMEAEEFSKKALFASHPVNLGSRCTVFMNSQVKQSQKDGATVADISAGLSVSVVKNAIYKVIRASSPEELGRHVVVQGGTFYNEAVLRAFEKEMGLEVIRPNIAGLMGAYGAALYGMKKAVKGNHSTLLTEPEMRAFHRETESRSCGQCGNNCQLTVNTFSDGGRLISGNRCERPITGKKDDDRWNLYEYKRQLLLGYKPGENRRGRIGLPLCLNFWELYPFWHTFFTKLGFQVVHSPMSSRKLYLEGQGSIPSDTACFPAKLAHGHIEFLAKLGVDAIFYPCMTYNIDEGLGQNHYNCPVVAYYPEVLAGNCDCLKNTKFIYDYVGIHRPHDFTKKMTAVMEREFGPIPHGEIKAAVEAAYGEYERHMKQIREKGAEIMAAARKEGRRIIVLAGRPYHVDPEVNHGIDTLITQFGAAVITEDSVSQLADPFKTTVLNQWTYHARLYAAAKYCCSQPDMDLVQLVSFGCGVDAITTDETREILREGGKLYTQLKIDEITNLGAVRIRLRSLFAALEEQEET
mgnify:CR=1 FL=1